MAWNLGAIVATTVLTVGVTAAIAGCIEPPAEAIGPRVYTAMAGAEVATVGEPGPQDLPFGEALVAFSHELGDLHACDGEQADAGIRAEVVALATILERLPAAAAQPGLRHAANVMRAAMEPSEPPIEDVRRALAVAATSLLHVAQRDYRKAPEVAARARDFAGAVSAIDSGRTPPDRAGMILALVRAERLLAAMYAVNVAPLPR
jgi:hypothetical protein